MLEQLERAAFGAIQDLSPKFDEECKASGIVYAVGKGGEGGRGSRSCARRRDATTVCLRSVPFPPPPVKVVGLVWCRAGQGTRVYVVVVEVVVVLGALTRTLCVCFPSDFPRTTRWRPPTAPPRCGFRCERRSTCVGGV